MQGLSLFVPFRVRQYLTAHRAYIAGNDPEGGDSRVDWNVALCYRHVMHSTDRRITFFLHKALWAQLELFLRPVSEHLKRP